MALGVTVIAGAILGAAGPGSAAVTAAAFDRTETTRASRAFARQPLVVSVAREKAEAAAAKKGDRARALAKQRAAVKAAAEARARAAAAAKAKADAAAKAKAAAAAKAKAKAAAAAKAKAQAEQRERAAKATQAAAAAKEATRAAAAQRAAKAAHALRSVPAGDAADHREYARTAAAKRGWGETEFGCLDAIWTQESQWKVGATNPTSGAYGIPQSLPGDKMASAGSDWRTNAHTQIDWGLDYIAGRYKTPCAAWAFKAKTGWY
jgi:membrane protein involved in colicin uptake